jgi:hypothetical protein
MSARKLGRLAGLVFVLAAVFGGVGVATHDAQHESGGAASAVVAIRKVTLETVWQ